MNQDELHLARTGILALLLGLVLLLGSCNINSCIMSHAHIRKAEIEKGCK